MTHTKTRVYNVNRQSVDSTVNDDRCRRHFHDISTTKYEKWSSHNFQGTGLINHLTITLIAPTSPGHIPKPSSIFRLSLKASRKVRRELNARVPFFIYLSFFFFLCQTCANRSSTRERGIGSHLHSPFARIVLALALFVLNITIIVDYVAY